MGHRLTLLSAFLIISFILLSQYQPGTRTYRTEYDKAEALYNTEDATEETDSLALVHYQKTITLLGKKHTDDSVCFDAYVKAGILAMSAQQDSLALQYFSNSVALQKSTAVIPDSLLFRPYLFAGNSYYNLYNFDSALYFYKQAEIIYQQFPAINEAERLYNKTGVLYYETGDYKKSIQYFNKALAIVEAAPEGKQYFIINYKNNIASALRKLQHYDQALVLYKSLLQYNINADELWHNIGVTYLDAGNYGEALTCLGKVRYNNAAKYNDISKAHLKSQSYKAASITLEKALALHRKNSGTQKNVQYGLTLKYKGDFDKAVHSLEDAIQHYQQAIIQIDPDFNDSSINSNPVSFQGMHQYALLFETILAKARAINEYYTRHREQKYLQNALAAYQSAIRLAAHVEKMYDTDDARLFLKKNADTAYQEYAATGLQLFELTKDPADLQNTFKVIENSKASVLQADLHELELSSIPGLPQGLIQSQKKLKAELARLNIQASQANENQEDSLITIKIRDLDIELSRLQNQLNDDPKYQSLKFSSRQTTVDSIQKHFLSADDALLSYYYVNNQLICFYVTKDQFGHTSTNITGDFSTHITQLRNMLNSPGAGDRKAIRELSTVLYQQLISPVTGIIRNKKHLVIIPYNEISYIPFDMLADPANDELLLSKFAIRYNYSANFLTSGKTSNESYTVLAMAPFTSSAGMQDQPVLKASEAEVGSVKGKVLLGKSATKNNFVNLLGEYPVIHLATHAIANDSAPIQSYISFYGTTTEAISNRRLYAPEIYNLDMSHVKLVILSACETGSGQLIHGEGVMSLSRAFSYAGCKSTVASLWKADDAATAFITRKMHHYLGKGDDKDIALQKAKSDYLNSSEIEDRFKTPAYWSHLVLIGDGHSVTGKSWNTILIGAILLAILTACYLAIKKTVRR
ncbi:CHAT domain-containing protein [Flavihumibacter fluvii]|uniref:CHAT domain-containing protein n=1 Tax=Flavihumibacter fluvii TaxID=2838157 RepID=UPI001BDED1E9|nr:CHAT domain-containing protein [Flavihumibacter fluvii]ULQ52054.1 CHAT domain-containing protein [Flavihumibacter fluvii]